VKSSRKGGDEKVGKEIRIAIVGVGNCASSLLQGIEYYRHHGESNLSG